jgi:hypothetical protein
VHTNARKFLYAISSEIGGVFLSRCGDSRLLLFMGNTEHFAYFGALWGLKGTTTYTFRCSCSCFFGTPDELPVTGLMHGRSISTNDTILE